MIEINLLPLELRRKEGLSVPKLPIIPMTVFIAGSLVLLQLLLLVLIQVRKTTLDSLNAKFSSIALSSVEAEALKVKMENLSGKVKMMEALDASRFIWSKKLNEISNSLVSGVWLSNLYIEKEKTEGMMPAAPPMPTGTAGQAGAPQTLPALPVPTEFLILEGSALTEGDRGSDSIGRFVAALKANASFLSDFEEIELSGVERRTVGQSKTEIIDFGISCRFKEGKGP